MGSNPDMSISNDALTMSLKSHHVMNREMHVIFFFMCDIKIQISPDIRTLQRHQIYHFVADTYINKNM